MSTQTSIPLSPYYVYRLVRSASGNLYYGAKRVLHQITRLGKTSKLLPEKDKIKRVLIANFLKIGDSVVTSPVIRALKEKLPEAEIGLITKKAMQEIFESDPNIDKIFSFEEMNSDRDTAAVRKWEPDVTFVLGLPRADIAYAKRCGGISIGYDFKNRGYDLDYAIAAPYQMGKPVWDLQNIPKVKHQTELWIELLEVIDIHTKDCQPKLYVREEDITRVKDCFKKKGIDKDRPVICYHLWNQQRNYLWPVERWAELIKKMKEKYDAQAILTGSALDRKETEKFAELFGVDAWVSAGELSLSESVGLLQLADLLISVDTGPTHIANAS